MRLSLTETAEYRLHMDGDRLHVSLSDQQRVKTMGTMQLSPCETLAANSNGPRTDHWGTPELHDTVSEQC